MQPTRLIGALFVPVLLCVLFPAIALAGSAVVLEAEDGALSGPMVDTDHEGYRGTGFVDFNDMLGEYVEWTVNIEEEGFFAVSFRYANGSAESRPLELSVNGSPATVIDFPVTGDWSLWKFSDAAQVLLETGTNTIRVTAVTNQGANLDQIRVDVVADPDDIVAYEAEDALLVGPTVSIQHAGFTGDGYADYGTELGEYIEWEVDAPVDGIYSLKFRYALDDDPRPLLLTLNVAEEATIEFPPTDAWTNWALTEPFEVELSSGLNIIRATAANNVGANVDSLIATLLCPLVPENRAPTAILLDNQDVDEEIAGAIIGLLGTEDPDVDDEHVYSVSDPRFEVVEGMLMLAPGVFLDYETEPTVSIDVTTTDLGGLTLTQTFVIVVLNGDPFTQLLEAEDGNYCRAWARSWVPGYTGDGYLRFSRRRGAKVEWNTEIPTAGSYELTFTYTGFCPAAMRLRVNGDVVQPRLVFPRMRRGCWFLWRYVSVQVDLAEGDNSIRLEGLGRRRILLDSMTITGRD